jgi:tripartite-type tricarboxylate transporter receptor subunit TctC
MSRSPLFAVLFSVLCLTGLPQSQAADWPTKPIRLVVPSSAGGAADLLARTFASAMEPSIGQQFIIDNRPGAGGAIATEQMTRVEPDGYTLTISGLAYHVLGPALNPKITFDPVKDFTHIAHIGGSPVALTVHPSLGVKTYKELLDLAAKSDTGLDYVSPGTGTVGHVVGEYVVSHGKLKLRHVPYRGGGKAIVDFLAGHVKVGTLTWATTVEHVRDGKLIPLAISTAQRLPEFPNLPTFAEVGLPEMVLTAWFSISGPAKLPEPVVDRVNAALNKALTTPEVKKAMERDASLTEAMTPKEFTAFVQSEVTKWTPVVRSLAVSK